jgi:hypothetical protein
MASNKSNSYWQPQLQVILSTGIKQLEWNMDASIVKQLIRVIHLSLYVLGVVL